MLSVCSAAVHVGGWEMANSIYSRIRYKGSSKSTYRKPKVEGEVDRVDPADVVPDIRTYSIMLAVRHAADTAHMSLPNSSKKKQQPRSAPSSTRLVIDANCISQYLLLCIRTGEKQNSEDALQLVPVYFGLPVTHADPYIKQPSSSKKNASADDPPAPDRIELTPQTLTLLIHLSSRLRYPALGQHWFDIATKQLGVVPDDAAMHAIATLLLSAKQYDRVYDIATHNPQSRYRYQVALRACSLAVLDQTEVEEKWLERCKALLTEGSAMLKTRPDDLHPESPEYIIYGHREVVNGLATIVSCRDWLSAGKLVLSQRELLIDNPIDRLERIIQKQSTTRGLPAHLIPTDDDETAPDVPNQTEVEQLINQQLPVFSKAPQPQRVLRRNELNLKLLRKGLFFSKLALDEFMSGQLGNSVEMAKASILLKHIRL
eukprot:jgi/Hompol1/2310/HPOL_001969-RA